jgi:hypothetical protein
MQKAVMKKSLLHGSLLQPVWYSIHNCSITSQSRWSKFDLSPIPNVEIVTNTKTTITQNAGY